MSNVAINIAAEFTGKAAFKQATTAAQRLEKQVAKLGRGIGISLGTVAIGRFAKVSLNAFVADEAAATKLTVAVKNLGLEFANPYITDYISNLERTTKVADDELRPAFQRLLQQTGSIAQSQSILNTAIEVSRGSTESLTTVSEDLAKAYYGQTRSLRKYSLGLTQAQLETKDFAELQDILNSKFTGSSAAYLTSYAGQLGIVSLAWNNLQENAGKALFTLAGASGDQSSGARRLGFLIDAFGLGLVEMADTLKKAVAAFGQAYLGFSTPRENQTAPAAPTGQELFRQSMANDAKLKEIEARQAKLYKQQMTTLKKMTDEQKKQAALKKAGTVFDMDQIQILAALRRDVSENDRKRLEAQAAILNGNADLATKLTKDILMAQDKTGGLYQYFLSIGDAKIKNPFAFLDEWIIKFQEKLNSLKMPTTPSGGSVTAVAPNNGIVPNFIPPDLGIIATPGPVQGPRIPSTNVPSGGATFTPFGQAGGNGSGYIGTPFGQAGSIELKITGDGDLTNAIAKSLQNQSLSTGDPAYINRRTGGFAG
jgi:hypothetical protein